MIPLMAVEAVWLNVASEDKTVEAARQLALEGNLRQALAVLEAGRAERTLIRTLGEAPPADQAKRVLGVVVESGIGSSVLSIAAYADGQPRYFLSQGGGVIGETWTAEETANVQEIVRLAQELVDGMAPTEDRTLPKPGRVRFTVLTPGGSFREEDSFSTLSHGQGRWAKVFAASDKLVGLLAKHAASEQKK